PNQLQWLETLEIEHDNLRAALEWSRQAAERDPTEREPGLRLAPALGRYWLVRGHLSEGRRWLRSLLEISPDGTLARARALNQAAELAFNQGNHEAVRPLLEQGLEAAIELKYALGEVRCLHLRAAEARIQLQFEQSAQLLDTALHRFEAAGSSYMRGMWLYARAQAARGVGDADRAAQLA